MASAPTGTRHREFGQGKLAPAHAAICRALRPLPKWLATWRGIAVPDVASVSEALLLEAAAAGRADCVYVFCRINADAIRDLVFHRVSAAAFPFKIDPLVAEVLAEVADSNRIAVHSQVNQLYQSIPAICERVIDNAVDDMLGFVPTLTLRTGVASLSGALSDRLELPDRLVAKLKRVVDSSTTQVLVAQALLELSVTDRCLLLACNPQAAAHERSAPSVADLLSLEAAQRRFLDELDRIVRWLRMAMGSDPSSHATNCEEESR